MPTRASSWTDSIELDGTRPDHRWRGRPRRGLSVRPSWTGGFPLAGRSRRTARPCGSVARTACVRSVAWPPASRRTDCARRDQRRGLDQLEAEYPETNIEMGVGFVSLHEWVAGDVRAPLLMVFGAVGPSAPDRLCQRGQPAVRPRYRPARRTRSARCAWRRARAASCDRACSRASRSLAVIGGVAGLATRCHCPARARSRCCRPTSRVWPRSASTGACSRSRSLAVVGTSLLFGVLPSLRASRHRTCRGPPGDSGLPEVPQ